MTAESPRADMELTEEAAWQQTLMRGHDEIHRLCRPGETWRMTIPANPQRDSDLILSDALDAAEGEAKRLQAERDDLRARLAAVEARVAEWESTGPAWFDPPADAATEIRAALASPSTHTQHDTDDTGAGERESLAARIETDTSGPWNAMHREALHAAAEIVRGNR